MLTAHQEPLIAADIKCLGQGMLRCVTATVVALGLRPLQVSR
jgi:hypothetical protein